MIRVVSIQFNTAGKLYDFDAGTLELNERDRVVVETERGLGVGTVVGTPVERPASEISQALAKVKRVIGEDDEMTLAHHSRREQEAYQFCLQRIQERGMEMKLVRVEQMFDGSKAIFYFTADGRVDFRELVKDLAHTFHTRIEMRQIGVRDEAKMVGGLGICGRELCCATFLRDFQPVSVKMAKEQNLALNPTKISGQCGRLLCCLDYEYETYCDLRKTLPRCGKKACAGGQDGVVEKVNLLTGEMVLKLDDGKHVSCHVNDIESTPAAGGGSSTSNRVSDQGGSQRREKPPAPPAPETPTTNPVASSQSTEREGASSEERQKRRRRPRNNRNRKQGKPSSDTPTQE